MKKTRSNQNTSDTKKGDESMVLEKNNVQSLDVNFILANGKEISSQEALADIIPIDWDEDVLNGIYKEKTIIKSKSEEDK